jgi:DNA gyrase subunit A
VKTINVTDKTGSLIAIKPVSETDDLMIINKSGVTIRMAVKDLRVMGRATQGVRLIKLDDDDAIASVTKVDIQDDEVIPVLDENMVLPTNGTPSNISDLTENASGENNSDDNDAPSEENNPDETNS